MPDIFLECCDSQADAQQRVASLPNGVTVLGIVPDNTRVIRSLIKVDGAGNTVVDSSAHYRKEPIGGRPAIDAPSEGKNFVIIYTV